MPAQWSDHNLVCYKYLRHSNFSREDSLLAIIDAAPDVLWDQEVDVVISPPSSPKGKHAVYPSSTEKEKLSSSSKRKTNVDDGIYFTKNKCTLY